MEYNDNINEPVLRSMPFNNDAERAVLAAMIIKRDLIHDVMGIVSFDDFYIDRHRQLYGVITDMFNRRVPIDPVTLPNELDKQGMLDSIGGMDFLVRLLDASPSTDPSSVKYHARIVSEKAALRRLIDLCESTAARCFEGDGEFDDMLASAEQGIINISRSKNSTALTHISAYLEESIDRMDELSKNDSDITGITTGFIDLDKRTAGLHSSEFILIAGRPGMGKSALGLNIAQTAAVMDDKIVAIFSLEMPGIQIANRMLSAQAKVSSERIKRGDLKDDDWMRIGEAMAALHNSQIFIDDNSSITTSQIAAKCRKLKMEKGLDLVVIDYMQLMTMGSKSRSGNRQEEVSSISRALKVLANDLEIPIIALSQLNRAAEKRESKEPVLSDLRESGSIEQDADMVIMIYREGYYNDECEEPNKTKIKFEKHRNGETGEEYLTWLGEYVKFANWSGMRE